MNKKNTCKIVIAFVVVLALVLPSSAMFANVGTINKNASSSEGDNNIDLQTLDDSISVTETVDWWPMFGHDLRHTGYSTSEAPDTNNILWEFGAGAGIYSSPAIVDGRVFFNTWDGGTYCLDTLDGSILWNNNNVGYVYVSSPAVADGRVFVAGTNTNHSFYCLDALDGSEIWRRDIGETSYLSPAVVDGRVFVGSEDKNLYCLDASDGSEIWNYTTGARLKTSPAVVDGKVFFSSLGGQFYCLNVSDGSLIWNRAIGVPYSSPAVVDGKIFVGSNNNNVYCLDAVDGLIIWNYTTGDQVLSSPSVAYGKVYVGSIDSNIYCLNAIDGSLIWNYTTGDRMRTSPAVADGKVFINSEDDNLYCLNASDGLLIWSYNIGFSYSSPAIAEGNVFIGTGHGTRKVYCFGSQPNRPPYQPSDPDPCDGETNVDINADLSWTGGDPNGDPVTYDVYFGTTSPPPKVVSNQSSTTYDPDLDYETQYYWQIVAWDNHGASTEGPIWDFTTEEEDTTPPVTTCDLDGIMEDGVYITDVTVTLTATDDSSGVAETFYRLNDDAWEEYINPVVVSDDGDHIVSFYSVDNAGNAEDTKTESFTIQHPCPIEIEISGGLGVNAVVTNTGEDDITDLEWSINITGGLLGLIDKQVNGIIPILGAGDSVTVKSGIFFGLGQINITVTAGCAEGNVDGKQFIIFTKIMEI